MSKKRLSTFNVLGIEFFSGSYKKVIETISFWIERNEKRYICVTSVHGVVESQRNKDLFKIHRQAGMVVPDGMPIVWMGKLMGFSHTRRIYGPDLFLHMCEEVEKRRYRVFFYGTTKKTLVKLRKALLNQYPRLKIGGILAPPFRKLKDEEIRTVRKKIDKVKPQLIFIGLSTPKQEFWMQENIKHLNANVLIGVGAAFDFIAGIKLQAPRWIQNSGFEWLYRLAQEPRRLWGRYSTIIPLFFYFLVKDKLTYSQESDN